MMAILCSRKQTRICQIPGTRQEPTSTGQGHAESAGKPIQSRRQGPMAGAGAPLWKERRSSAWTWEAIWRWRLWDLQKAQVQGKRGEGDQAACSGVGFYSIDTLVIFFKAKIKLCHPATGWHFETKQFPGSRGSTHFLVVYQLSRTFFCIHSPCVCIIPGYIVDESLRGTDNPSHHFRPRPRIPFHRSPPNRCPGGKMNYFQFLPLRQKGWQAVNG